MSEVFLIQLFAIILFGGAGILLTMACVAYMVKKWRHR